MLLGLKSSKITARRAPTHLTSRTYSITSRIFYTLSFICTTLAFFFYVYRAYEKWKIHPDIAVKRNQKFLGEIPFPAVTICSPIFARPELLFYRNYSSDVLSVNPHILKSITPDETNYLISNMQACNPSYTFLTEMIYKRRTRDNVVKLLDESFLKVREVFAMCYYGSGSTECSRILNRVLTDRGFCYTFNMQGFNAIFNVDAISEDFNSYKGRKISKSPYASHELYKYPLNDDNETVEWTLDKGFDLGHDEDVIPVAAQRSVNVGFHLYIRKNNLHNSCTMYAGTFNYYFHLPNEIPTMMHQKQFIQLDMKSFVTLTATVYTTNEDLRKLRPEARGCYFEGERQLKFFKSYTKSNCDFECMTNFTLQNCGCVKFSMPRDKNTSVCDIYKIKCYYRAMMLWPLYNATTKQEEASCGCLRTCNDIKYKIVLAETSETTAKQNKILKKMGLEDEDALSYIKFDFDSIFVVEEESYAPYALQNFIADTGGLLGLFIGCSILSIFEFVYSIAFKVSSSVTRIKGKCVEKVPSIVEVKPLEHLTAIIPWQRMQYDEENFMQKFEELRCELNAKLNKHQREIQTLLREKHN